MGPPVSKVQQRACVLAGDGLDPAMVCLISDGIGVAGCFPRSTSVDNLCLSPPSPRVSKHV
jgi:hypothetical protein